MKRRVCAIVMAALVLMALLTACGGGGDSKYAGKYYTSKIGDWTVKEYADLLEISEQEAKEFIWIELKSGGKGTFNSDGDADEISWKVSGDKITFTADGENLEGTIKDKVITLDLEGELLELTKG